MIATAKTQCLIAGGGPAGMMLALLLARGGVEVTVLEKHGDFLRDFRGDTVHPSTIRLLGELGLGEQFRALPQSRLGNFQLPGPGNRPIVLGDFDTLKPPYDHVAMVPQWDLLDLLVSAARQEPTFTLRMDTEATGLLTDRGVVRGVHVRDADGVEQTIRADLVVACDGRGSVLRRDSGITPREFSVPFDTWWFRIPRTEAEQQQVGNLEPRFDAEEILLGFTRPTYHQLAYFTHKGDDARLRAEGVQSFRARVARLRPDLADRVGAIGSMDDLHMLDVKLNRVRRWFRPGLLLLGDAAHAMSPVGGVGINLAVQDAVAAGTRLRAPLLAGRLGRRHLAAVQLRRTMPTVLMQTGQRIMQRMVFNPTLDGRRPKVLSSGPLLLRAVPALRRVTPRMIGFGPLPEHAPDFARRPASDQAVAARSAGEPVGAARR